MLYNEPATNNFIVPRYNRIDIILNITYLCRELPIYYIIIIAL